MFNKTTHDFGTVTQQKEYSTSFVSTLPIVVATPDCGCMISVVTGNKIHVTGKFPKVPAPITGDYEWKRRIQVTLRGEDDKMIPTTLVVKAVVKR